MCQRSTYSIDIGAHRPAQRMDVESYERYRVGRWHRLVLDVDVHRCVRAPRCWARDSRAGRVALLPRLGPGWPFVSVVNLTALVESRAKMTPGEYREWGETREGVEIKHCDGDGGMLSIATVRSFNQRKENAAGIVATHNAADVLIEVVRAAKEWADSDDEDRADELEAMLAALAKVTL